MGNEINSLITEVKKKKELKGISSLFIEKEIQKTLFKNKIKEQDLPKFSKKEYKQIVKEIRANLRTSTGMFQPHYHIIDQNVIGNNGEKFESVIKSHQSTKERLPHYKELKDKIKNLGIKSILDLGCGVNPLVLANSSIEYFASDIREDELSLIEEYFNKNNIKGKCFIFDLQDLENYSKLPKADLCILFKVLDLMGNKKHEIVENLFKLNCKYFLISFPTVKLSGNKMNRPRRIWFEAHFRDHIVCEDVWNTDNEIFYLLKKLS